MPWGAAIGAGVSALANHALSSGSSTNGGAGTQTVDKSPWLPAQPWLRGNITQGQNLQNAYTAQPFSPLQNQAYQNQANQSAYMRAAVPSLLGQIESQQVGFDRSNPNARPNAFSFDGLLSAARDGSQASQASQAAQQRAQQTQQSQQGQGLLGMLTNGPTAAPLNLNANTPQVAPPPAPATPAGIKFASAPDNAMDAQIAQAMGWNGQSGYGAFKYGDQPIPGTQAYLDQQLYFMQGGLDPQNLYLNKQPDRPAGGA